MPQDVTSFVKFTEGRRESHFRYRFVTRHSGGPGFGETSVEVEREVSKDRSVWSVQREGDKEQVTFT